MQRPKAQAACPFCGNPVGNKHHNELCIAWKYRNSLITGWVITGISLIGIIFCSMIFSL